MLALGLSLVLTGLAGLVVIGILIYVIVNRIKQIDKEKFPDRDN